MTYEEAIKVIWPDAVSTPRLPIHPGKPVVYIWHVRPPTSKHYTALDLTFDALLAVWRERLDGWNWIKVCRVGGGYEMTVQQYHGINSCHTPCTSNPIHDFAILTALALQAKEPKRG